MILCSLLPGDDRQQQRRVNGEDTNHGGASGTTVVVEVSADDPPLGNSPPGRQQLTDRQIKARARRAAGSSSAPGATATTTVAKPGVAAVEGGGGGGGAAPGGAGTGAEVVPPVIPDLTQQREQEDRMAKSRALGSSSYAMAGATSVMPGAVAAVTPGAVAVGPSEVEGGNSGGTTAAATTTTTLPPTISQREQEDMVAKSSGRRVGSGRSLATEDSARGASPVPGAVAVTITPGAVAVGPSEVEGANSGGNTTTTTATMSQQEKDTVTKNRGRRVGSGRSLATEESAAGGRTPVPGAVAVSPGDAAVVVGPSKEEHSKSGSTSQQEQDMLAKNRGRRGGSGRSLTEGGESAETKTSPPPPPSPQKTAQELKDANLKASLRGRGAAAVRPGVVSVQAALLSAAPPVVENSVTIEPLPPTVAEGSAAAAAAASSTNTQSQRDDSLKASLRSNMSDVVALGGADGPSKVGGAGSVNSVAIFGNGSAPSDAAAGSTQAEQDAQAKARARSSTMSAATIAGHTVYIAETVEEPAAGSVANDAVDSSSSSRPPTAPGGGGGGGGGLDELARRREQRAAARASRRGGGSSGTQGGDGSARSMDGSARSMDSSSRSIDAVDPSTAVAGVTADGTEDGSGVISTDGGPSTDDTGSARPAPVFANMAEDERQRRYDAKMIAMNRRHADSRDKRPSGAAASAVVEVAVSTPPAAVYTSGSMSTGKGGRSATTSSAGFSSDVIMAETAQGLDDSMENRRVDLLVLDDQFSDGSTPASAAAIRSSPEDKRQRRYDAKIAGTSQGHADRLEKSGNNRYSNRPESTGGAAGVLNYSATMTPTTAVTSTPTTSSESRAADDDVYSSKDFLSGNLATGQIAAEQSLSRPVTTADRGIAVAPDVEYGEYRRQEVLDNELVVAVAIEEDDGDDEKDYLVAAHAVEYDPDSKPPIFKNRRFRLYTILGGCLFLIVLIVLIIVSVTGGGDDNRSVTTVFLTDPPTEAPTGAPSTSRESMYRSYFAEEVSPDVTVPGTAHFLASEWIMNEDPLQLDVDSSRLLQRYMLAFLYFHTSELGTKPWLSCGPPGPGDNDTCTFFEFGRLPDDSIAYTAVPGKMRWMSSVDECQWNGVLCATGDTVLGIRIGKLLNH